MEIAINNNIETTWENYLYTRDYQTKNELILHYMWLVKFVLSKMNLPVNSILEEQDFLAIGILGLNETIERFSIDRGVKFESYAIPRIRGIIKDEMRKLDWLSRNTRKKAHDFLVASDKLQIEQGNDFSQTEMMKKLDVDPITYRKYLAAAAAAKATISFNESKNVNIDGEELDIFDTVSDRDAKDILEELEDRERTEFLVNYLEHLDTKSRLIMSLYYYEEMTFKEIGNSMDLTESRVCQIHTKVIKEIRKKMKDYEHV